MLATNDELTAITMEFDVAGEPDIQLALLVITHVIASLFARVEEV